MRIDTLLPTYDVTEIQRVHVEAPPDVTWGAIRETDLRSPVLAALFALRELPNRISRRMHGEPPPPQPERITFGNIATPDLGFFPLDELPGEEFVVGSVGRFWERDYGWHRIPPEQFTAFAEPGFAKLAISFSVHPAEGGCVLRYEARTATTDEESRRRFRHYWYLIHPGVALVMRSAVRRIAREAEARARAAAPSAG